MSAIDIIANMSRGWNRQPAAVARAPAADRVCAALWKYEGDDPQEIAALADPSLHVISFTMSRAFAADMFLDDQQVWSRRVHPGSICIISAGREPRAIQYGRSCCLHLYVPARLIDELASEELGKPQEGVVLLDPECNDVDPALHALAVEIERELQNPTALSRLRIDVLMQDAAIRIVRCHAGLPASSRRASVASVPNDWRIRRTLSNLDARLSDEIGLAELAGEVGLSQRQYSALFRDATGLPPYRWVLKRRIERACEMLCDPRRQITNIALELGFASSQHFATIFRKHMGTTPTAYRQHKLS